MTPQDREDLGRYQEAQRRLSGYSVADEIGKLAQLRDDGKITEDEYERMKRQAMITV